MSDQSAPIARISTEPALPDVSLSEHDSSVCLTELLDDARTKATEVFERLHGRGFLVRWIYDGDFDVPAPLGSNTWSKNTMPLGTLSGNTQPVMGAMRPEAFYVYKLPFHQKDTLLVGRAHTADVCIGDMSVSTMHAEIEWAPDRKLLVTDRGSTNGTRVAKQQISFGNTGILDFGKTLRFGTVKLTYMPVQQFIDLVGLVASDLPLEIE